MSTARFLFPHQLFQFNPLLEEEGDIYFIEESLFFHQFNFHKQKIAFHRASMQFYTDFLQSNGHAHHYIQATQPECDVRVLVRQLHEKGLKKLHIIDPVDDWLLGRITRLCDELSIELHVIDSPQFLNTRHELTDFFNPTKKKYFQTEFYKKERLKRRVLLDGTGAPLGGQWTFDVDNRKKYPKGKAVVKVEFPAINAFTKEAHAYTEQHFSQNIGELNATIHYPIGFEESEHWLKQFLHTRFEEFGEYEDAILQKEVLLNHSLLTPMLNVGMLTPDLVLKASIQYGEQHAIPINSLEGFVRQIMGWREFIRGVYVAKGREERTRNYWRFTRKIPKSFYDGTTGILPVDATIQKVLKTGYCHHIERLMVLGNFMLLCEFDPDEVYRWFMELFIDAYDWVMVPNVYGMSQFADGGMMSTKPYISGSNYLMKMSDYPKGEWQEIWDALFWRCMDKQRDFFLKNPRLGMLVKTFDKWPEQKKLAIRLKAETYLETLN